MKVSKRDGSVERQILVAILVNDQVCAAVTSRWNDQGLFRSRWADVVCKWCVDFCKSHNEAPRKHVESLFSSWSDSADPATISLVESFLESISDEYDSLQEEINPGYVIDLAGRHFNEVKLKKVISDLESCLESGEAERGWDELQKASRVDLGTGSGVNVLSDRDFVKRCLSKKGREPLFVYPGALGEFFGVADCFARDCFVAFCGPKGRGKTGWLIDAAWRAMEQRNNVAFFEVGDMSELQAGRRLIQRAMKRPLKAGTLKVPSSIVREGAKHRVEWKERHYESEVSEKEANERFAKIKREVTKSDKDFLKLSTHPARGVSVAGITSVLRHWEREGWVADCVFIDYADLLAPLSSKEEGRDSINSTWIALRALSQSYHCLVVTATQTKAASYYADLVTRDHFADDRRKIDHTNVMIGINQTREEMDSRVTRLNFLAVREDAYKETECVAAAGCPAINNLAVKSCW